MLCQMDIGHRWKSFGNAIPLAISEKERAELDIQVEKAIKNIESGNYTEEDTKIIEDAKKKYKEVYNDNYFIKLSDNGFLLDDSGKVTPANEMVEKMEKVTKKIDEIQEIYSLPEKVSSDKGSQTLDDMISDADSFVAKASTDETDSGVISANSLQNFSKSFYNILLTIGIIVAVLAGMIIGIRFMIGGAEEKANIKEMLVPYVVGCVIVFGAFAIWKIVVTILSQI